MIDLIYQGQKLKMVQSRYRNNMATYLGLFTEDGEPFADITVNTPYSAINAIVLDYDFLDLEEDFKSNIINYLTDGKVCDIDAGFITLPKYWLNLKVLDEIEEL
ncbi:MAG: hypothetical protein Q4B60_08995 [Erysipelotrichaceae bacterium]|nr:hypothetical protein [Erysipelotrichaceae bacterium]